MTNNITDGMIRLSEEISALRHNRAALTCDLMVGRVNLGNTVAEMIAGFQRDREEMGEKTKTELGESRSDLEHTVAEMIAGFQRDREEMGEKTKVEVGDCVSSVKDAVAGLRQSVVGLRAEFASDINGARQAWSGSTAERAPIRGKVQKRSHQAHARTKRKKGRMEKASKDTP
jgi:hypothetical protein